MTSNLGSDRIQELAGEENYAAMKAEVMDIVGQYFRPEFINRIDEAVVFHPLLKEQIRAIARIQMRHLQQRLADRDMHLEVSDAALDKLGEAGFDPVYGARPLKRAIQQQVENPLAQQILSGRFAPGDTIRVDMGEKELASPRDNEANARAFGMRPGRGGDDASVHPIGRKRGAFVTIPSCGSSILLGRYTAYHAEPLCLLLNF